MASSAPVTGDTPITIKITLGQAFKKFKLPLKDLSAEILPGKLKHLLGLPTHKSVTFERFSDSAGGFITLDASNPAVYKTLVRAAKAKLKLRLRATVEAEEPKAMAPAPVPVTQPLTGSGSERKNIGAGIFEFKDSQAEQMSKVLQNFHESRSTRLAAEAPLPRPFNVYNPKPTSVNDKAFQDAMKRVAKMSLSNTPLSKPEQKAPQVQALESFPVAPTWSVYCNECDAVMMNEHFHCSVCDGGDYDLCQRCVDSGKLCPGEGHWLVKRFFKDGQVISSTTERLPPKPRQRPAVIKPAVRTSLVPGTVPASKITTAPKMTMPTAKVAPVTPPGAPVAEPLRSFLPNITKAMPGAFNDDVKTLREESLAPTRTCNCCVAVLPEAQFVHCKVCEDYDLCMKCHTARKHGHHPGHGFVPAVEGSVLTSTQSVFLAPGRGNRHFAICDGCERSIVGVRHKCFECPDFDYCNDCSKLSHVTHPGHRFALLYDQISVNNGNHARHYGIYCDGPACSSKSHQSYIHGVRYKCVVCHDTDFCANCEALPNNDHNKTHPLLKITSPINGLHISTVNKEGSGLVRGNLGDDALMAPSPVPAAKVIKPTSSASSVKTVAHIEPTSTEPKMEVTKIEDITKSKTTKAEGELQAHFVSDTIPDGIIVRAGTRFTQVWNMVNPGPRAWPAGCSVRFTGGDNMLNVDHESPISAAAMAEATESNVIGREVKPGEHIAFKVVMKAPFREGKAISYWRLKAADGTPFGHRLWCDVSVRLPVDPPKLPEVPKTDPIGASRDTAVNTYIDDFYRPEGAMHDYQRRAAQWAARRTHGSPSPTSKPAVNCSPAMTSREAQIARHAYFQRKLAEMDQACKEVAAESAEAGSKFADKKPVKQETTSEAPPKYEAVKEEKAAKGTSDSQMIFPTLDKESPESSTYQSTTSTRDGKGKAATVEDEETGAVTSAEKPAEAASEESTTAEENDDVDGEVFQDITSEIEVLSASSEFSDDDDGFLTDEEYDILDASDQETIASPQ